jgi:hypothetical protein
VWLITNYSITARIKITKEDLVEVVDNNGRRRWEINKDKLEKRINDLRKSFRDPSIKREALSTVGVKILELASKNAGFYYENSGTRYFGNEPEPFVPLSPSTEEAYDQRGLMPHAGLNLGYSKILHALMIGGDGNIFNVTSNTLTVGISSRLAILHEFGGLRLPGKHIVDMGISESASIYIPPRPFFLPAFRHVRDSPEESSYGIDILPNIFMPYFEFVREMLKNYNIELEG